MKKIISLVVACICLMATVPAQAQLKWGVKGGMNVSHITFDASEMKSVDANGFFIGPMAEFTFPIVGLGIDASLLYSQRGMCDDAIKQKGLDIPVNLKYTLGLGSLLGVYAAAGPNFYFDFADADGWNKERAMVGVNVGAGVKLFNHLQLGFNYNIPLGKSGDVKVSDALDAVLDTEYRNKTWQISAVYLF